MSRQSMSEEEILAILRADIKDDEDDDMKIEITTTDLNANINSTTTTVIHNKRKRKEKIITYKDLSSNNIQSICLFLTVSELLAFRRVNKLTKIDVDKCKKQTANTIGPALMSKFNLSSSFMNLIQQCEAVITGSALLSVIYGEEPYEHQDIDIIMEVKHVHTVREWMVEDTEVTPGELMNFCYSLDYYEHFDERGGGKPKPNFSIFTCQRVDNLLSEPEIPLPSVQFTFLHSGTVKDQIEKYMNISALRNWFDGKKLYICFQNDIVSRTYSIKLKETKKMAVCADIPWNRIYKYRERGFTCINLDTRICSRLFRDMLLRFQLHFIDNRCFFTEVSMNGCAMIPFTEWMNKMGWSYTLDCIKVGRSAGMPYSENYEQVFQQAHHKEKVILRLLYF